MMTLLHSQYPDLEFIDIQHLAAALSDERRTYSGGDTPAAVAASCLRRHANMLDAYGWHPSASRTAGWLALLADRSPDALRRVATHIA